MPMRNVFRRKSFANHFRSSSTSSSDDEDFVAPFSGRTEAPIDIPTAARLQTISPIPPTEPRAHEIWCSLRANPAAWMTMMQYWDLVHKEDAWDPELDPGVSSEPLVYRPLSNADAEIRLLTILPGPSSAGNASPVRCTLERVSLHDAPTYTALSYTWGAPNETRPVVVNGHRFNATTNLYWALRRLRAIGKTSIWIDAICINQNDREEKSQQLPRMRSIYARAKEVFVWLGPETKNSNLAMWLLKMLSKPDDGTKSNPGYIEAMKERESSAPQGRFAEAWTAFDDLFALEYWKRLWIIQEIAASTDVIVCCGQKSISWPDLETAFWGKKYVFDMFTKRTDADLTAHPRNTHQLFDFWAWKKAIARVEPQSLLRALIDSRRSKASNPRDHVYALLGISSDSSTLVPIPNYKLSVEQVYTDLTKAMIQANGNIDIICLRGRSDARNNNLPSWVPDWSALAEVERPWLFRSALSNSGKIKDGLATAFDSFDSFDSSFGVRVEGNLLCVSGRVFGVVDGLSTGISPDGDITGEMTQPTILTTAYVDGHGHAAAVNDALMMEEFSKKLENPSRTDLIHYLLHPIGIETMSTHGHSLLAAWLEANRNFKLCDFELYIWATKLYGHQRQWKKRVSHYFESKDTFTEDMHKYMANIETTLKGGMRLMTTNLGHVGMAHPQTQRGDHICLLEGMSSPVILRPCSDEDLGPDALRQQRAVQEDMKMSRYSAGFRIEIGFRSYKVVGEGYVRMAGMAKELQQASYPFGTFLLH
ncbi:hypothetical protein QQS21_006937 [Conoideocrella luteorostrata]|uniref:Heterokaryon incompatibility domain-containing protein n=1 Tax=Conoideocrella luteorostrata TaxID=1105319 RepID=A0AAJ0CMI1_9HYPO|nr:hypothetical protein QQS21_006937 [Conoideocrella luteorostrata]